MSAMAGAPQQQQQQQQQQQVVIGYPQQRSGQDQRPTGASHEDIDANLFPKNNLTIQTRTTVLQDKYSYLNAVKRSINTSSTPLIILINGTRLRLHS
ncbi:unnamed protein product [Bathycoccus prasinos]